MTRVTVWNEFVHEVEHENIRAVYPNGIHEYIAEFLGGEVDFELQTATLRTKPLTLEMLETTDVLIWWGHAFHGEVPDELVQKIHERVLRGMGLIVLHSGHFSKIFRSLMGTSCRLVWRDNDRERLWCCAPNHPIAKGLPAHFELAHEEMYGEFFDIPIPDELVFMGWFAGGEVFRSGCVWNRGLGKVFYFQPGHEEYPTYKDENIQQVIKNAVRYLTPAYIIDEIDCPNVEALEK